MITLIASIVGEKLARPVAIALGVALIIALLAIGKCSYDRHIVNAYVDQVQRDAAPATSNAAVQRAADTITNARNEKDLHNAIDAAPGGALSPAAHALACERLHKAGRNPASCGPAGGDGKQAGPH